MTLTLTEKNRRQYELRQEMHDYNRKAEFCVMQIAQLEAEYRRQYETPLFEEMFGG